MVEKLKNLYNECCRELESIGIDLTNPLLGNIDIKIAKRVTKRYGCCKSENPVKTSMKKIKKGRKIFIKYDLFENHHIEISKWVMDLDDKIIKNTIIHEIIHCFPGCNDHGENFKKYAKLINQNLGYNITRLGNKAEDYKESNLDYKEYANQYNYRITCKKCGIISYRQRIAKYFKLKYRCAKCGGMLEVEKLK